MSRYDQPVLRLASFGIGLAVLFGAGAGLGVIAGPNTTRTEVAATHADPGHAALGGAGPVPASPGPSIGDAGAHGSARAGGHTVEGLETSREGYTLETLGAPTTAGVPGELAFRLVGPAGTAVTAFTPTHDKALHLIVVRRDQTGFQHLHPEMSPDGVWRTPITLAAGDQRLLADFAPDGRTEAMTLGRDLPIAGDYRPEPLPAPTTIATAPDGYTVTLAGALTAGTTSPLTLTVARDGVPVGDLQPYLAAYGHLVALRTGDLAYLHVHPEGVPGDGRTPAGPDIRFAVAAPTAGPYRLYLDFAHQGVVRSVAFTANAAPAPTTNPDAAPDAGAAPNTADSHAGFAPAHGH